MVGVYSYHILIYLACRFNILKFVIPMGGHGKRVPDKKAPQGILQTLSGLNFSLFVLHFNSPL